MFTPNTAYLFKSYEPNNSGDLEKGNIVTVVSVDSEAKKVLVVKDGTDYVQELYMSELATKAVPHNSKALQAAAQVYALHKQESRLPSNFGLSLADAITIEDETSLTTALDNILTYSTTTGEKITNRLIVTQSLEKLKEGRTWTQVGLELTKQADVTKFQLGGVLLNALSDGEHLREKLKNGKSKYPATMAGFIQWVQDVFEFKAAKAYQLIKIYHRLTNLNIDESQIADIGFRKLYKACAHADQNNVEELLELARKHNYEDFTEVLHQLYSEEGDKSGLSGTKSTESFDDTIQQVQNVTFSKFDFKLPPDEVEILKQAIHKYSVDNPDVSLSDKNPLRQVIMAMAYQYLDQTSPIDVLQQSPDRLVQYLEAIHPGLTWSYKESEVEAFNPEDTLDLHDYA